MRPGQLFNCEECSSSFVTKRELVSHANVHKRLGLVCPFCTHQPRDFAWPQDLRRHIRNQHKSEHQSMNPLLLSSGNCFYFCTSPEHYQKLHGASACDSEEAKSARQLMARWCRTHSRDLKKWQEGWILATSDTPTSCATTVSSAPSHTPLSNPSLHTAPLQHTSHTAPTPASHMTESDLKRKRPERSLSVQSISLATTEVMVHLQDEGTQDLFKVKLANDILQDPKSLSALTRRMSTITPHFTPPSSSWKMTPQDARLWEEISSHLGIHPKYITTILTQSMQTFKVVRQEHPNIAQTPPHTPSLPGKTSTSEHPTLTSTRSKLDDASSQCSEDGESLRSPSPFSLTGGDTPSYDPASPSYTPTPFAMGSSTCESPSYNPLSPKCPFMPSPSESPSYDPLSPKFLSMPTLSETAPCTTQQSMPPYLPTYTFTQSKDTQTATVKLVRTSHITNVTNTPALTTPVITLLPLTTAQSECSATTTITQAKHSTSTTPGCQTYDPTPKHEDPLKEAALKLLEHGSIPLLPAAPRE